MTFKPTCRNCGHESHCGIPLFKDISIQAPEYKSVPIEVCKKCRCDKCTPPDWG